MPRICLVQPPIRDFYLTCKRTFPAGLAGIAGALRAAGFTVALVDALAGAKRRVKALPPELADLEDFYGPPDRSPFGLFSAWAHHGAGFESVARRVSEAQPFLVGISSLFTAYADEALTTAEAVRRYRPEARIVVGGHHATVLPEQVMACAAVDFVIRGEGEQAMVALARALIGQGQLGQVPGLVWRLPRGKLGMNPPAIVSDLDRLPPAAIDLVARQAYRRRGHGAVQITASRGCPYRCSYCAFGDPAAPPYRRRSVDAVLAEIDAAAAEADIGFIDFEDENLSLDRAWFVALLKGIQRRFSPGTVELRAMNGLMPSTLDDALLALMQAAGFRALNLSLGTAVPRRARFFRRPDLRRAFDRALAAAARRGMTAVGYIIVGAPGQPAGESLSDLLYLARRPVLAGLSVYYPVPRTLDFERCRQMGLLPTVTARMRATALPLGDDAARRRTATLLRLGRLLNFIKALKDGGEPLPAPEALVDGFVAEASDRQFLGRRLLAAFLHDGKLRGADAAGKVWIHSCDTLLSERFRRALRHVPVCPSGHRPCNERRGRIQSVASPFRGR
ncbi:MAG: cobalamin-dependent protein [Desulfobacteraceae bacterium]|jgi:tRNA A37 methylthiotransferase MiaB|nr:cobalamin-dependent protein [Desulfobacteraceae bacterium]